MSQSPTAPPPGNPWLDILQSVLMSGQIPQVWPDQDDPGWRKIVEIISELKDFVRHLAQGNLDHELHLRGQFAGNLKALQANLRHLTWQVQQVAAGDLTQRVEFMGEFSTAFNQMIENLRTARDDLKASEERFRLMAENAQDVIWSMDLQGRFTYVSPSVERLRGYTVEEVMQQTIDEALTPASAEIARRGLAETIESLQRGEPVPGGVDELEQPCKDGSTVWTEVNTSLIFDHEGQCVGILGVSRDITWRRRAQQAERERLALTESLRDAAAALNRAASLEQIYSSLLSTLAQIIPYDAAQILILDENGQAIPAHWRGFEERLPGANQMLARLHLPAAEIENLKVILETKAPLLLEDVQNVPWTANPAAPWVRAYLGAPIIAEGLTIGFFSLFSEWPGFFKPEHVERLQTLADQAAVAIRKLRLVEQLRHLATTDGLTEVANRRQFFTLGEQEFARSQRYGAQLSALMLDIDFFKLVNDTYGHAVGDQVLREFARRCTTSLRIMDLFGRYGGEEFAIIAPHTSGQGALAMAERLRIEVAATPFLTTEGPVEVTTSVGVAGWTPECSSLQTLLNQADQALYIAKRKGRNQVVVL